MANTIQVRVDDELKDKSDKLFKALGTDTTTAIRIFLTQAVASEGFPFEITKKPKNLFVGLSERELLGRLEASRDHADKGMVIEAEALINELRNRYEL